MTPAEYLEENARRRAALQEEYDPIRGVGSPLERFELVVSDDAGSVWLPEAMRSHGGVERALDAGSLAAYAEARDAGLDETMRALWRVRMKEDFEFWCRSVARIENKEGEVVPFVLNRPQRLYVKTLEEQRLAGEPVRAIVLKHRQWGCTTLSYTYIAWHQIERHRRRDAWFVGLDQDGARDVLSRYDLIREHYPAPLHMRPHAGMQNTRKIPERECTLSVGTVQRPNAPSGRTPQFAHMFEVGKWPSNQRVSAGRVMQNMDSMLVEEEGTVGIIESTAQGETGVYFKELCDEVRSPSGDDEGYEFLFVGVFDDPQYQRALDDYGAEAVEAFTAGFDEFHAWMWDWGATLEQINWWRHQERKPGYVTKPWMLLEEFPIVAEHAFQAGLKRVFPARYVEALKAGCESPSARGRLVADAQEGTGAALAGISFEPARGGSRRGAPLSVWRRPGADYGHGCLKHLRKQRGIGEDARVRHRYCAASDVGPGLSEDASYSVTAVLDRAPLLWGAPPEIVAEWRGHEDVDRYAWAAARLAKWYDEAFWAIETNSLYNTGRTPESREPDFGMTVLHEIMPHYGNLYHREPPDDTKERHRTKAGWYTTKKTKQLIISALTRAQRAALEFGEGEIPEEVYADRSYIEREQGACQEMDTYLHVKGRMQAADGKHDDRVIVRGLLLHLSGEMPPPSLPRKRRKRRRPSSAAAI
jgi:hypothetical protein